jgi:hypothetical protein
MNAGGVHEQFGDFGESFAEAVLKKEVDEIMVGGGGWLVFVYGCCFLVRMTKVPWDIGQSMTMRRPTLLRGSRDWHSGQRGPQRLSNSRLICAPISSKITFETTSPLNGAKALMLRTFTPVQGHLDRGGHLRFSSKSVMPRRRRATISRPGKNTAAAWWKGSI